MTSKLNVRNVFKVFGSEREEALRLAREGLSKDEIFAATESVVAVNDVSMSVGEREIFVVMGLSGSGKSTLVRCLNRLIEPTSGTISVDGDDVTGADRESLRRIRLDKIAMVFQHFALFPHMTVVENAAYGLKVKGMGAGERREKALDALRAVGLDAWADVFPSSLSGGMQQRVGLARGLAVDPQILLMDEPFSALDPLIRREMQDELLVLQERFGTTIVFITHDLHEALKLGHQIAIMKDGRFVQVGDAEAIVTRPADDYVLAFTQDVDRSRVLVAGSVMDDVPPARRGQTVEEVTRRLDGQRGAGIHVVDERGRAIGFLSASKLAESNGVPVESVMHERFPRVPLRTPVFELFSLCGEGTPVAVLHADGRYAGRVQPLQLFERLRAEPQTAG